MTPMHLGAMHPFEQMLTLVLAFGPFLILGIVIVVRRRAEAREDELAGLRDTRRDDERDARAERDAQRER